MDADYISLCEDEVYIPASQEIESFHIAVGTKLDKKLKEKVRYTYGTFDCAVCYSVCDLKQM